MNLLLHIAALEATAQYIAEPFEQRDPAPGADARHHRVVTREQHLETVRGVVAALEASRS